MGSKIKKIVIGVLAGLGALTLLLTLVAVRFASRFDAPPTLPPAEQPLRLKLKLEGRLVTSSDTPVMQALIDRYTGGSDEVNLDHLIAALDRAAGHDSVRALFVEFGRISASTADLFQLRAAFDRFRASGKALHSWIPIASLGTYYVASASDRVAMPPGSHGMLTGAAISFPYFRSALAKLGVTMEVQRVGDYKAAMEPFMRDEPSREARRNRETLVAGLNTHFREAIAGGRGSELTPAVVAGWFRSGIMSSEQALAAKVVDELTYVTDAQEAMAGEWEGEWIEFDRFQRATAPKPLPAAMQGQGIAVVDARGRMMAFASGSSSQRNLTPDSLIPELQWARENEAVKAVILRIDSPGGMADAAELMWAEVHRLAAEKPVVAFLESMAASGGYYLAAPATKIIATPITIAGSIGVYMARPHLAKVSDKWGVSFHSVGETDRDFLINPGKSLSKADRQVLTGMAEETYRLFVDRVATGRSMDPAEVVKLATGEVWSGAQAWERGLVDALGTFQDAIAAAKDLADIEPDTKVPLLRWIPEVRDFRDCLRSGRHLQRCLPSRGAMASLMMGPATVGDRLHLLLESEIEAHRAAPVQMLWSDGLAGTVLGDRS